MNNQIISEVETSTMNYELVQTFERAEEIAQQMIDASTTSEPVIGVDCEGILRGRPLCLIQVSLHFEFRNY
jgi:hypothetical protein